MAQDDLITRLRQTRNDYAEELVWHRFLLDAYTGTGGFGGKVREPVVGYLGWAAEAYSNAAVALVSPSAEVVTYLDRYPREDDRKFARRRDVAHYLNYVEAIADVLISYVLKREMIRDGAPPTLTEWQKDVDGQGTHWDDLLNDVVKPRAALLGWMPLLFDQPPTLDGQTRAQTDNSGVQVHAVPLFPANLLEWELDDRSQFAWAKTRIDYVHRPDPLGPCLREEKYSIWWPDHVEIYTVTKAEGAQQERVSGPETRPHPFGAVPIAIWRHKPCPEDTVRGVGMINPVAIECRRLFNLGSELDEHLRQQVFALLQVPYSGTTPPDELIAGTDNCVGLPSDSKNEFKWLAPPESVAATYETRIANTVQEIYRLARIEYERGHTLEAASGVARAYEFEKTNRRLGDFAKQLARAEKRSYAIVGPALGVSADSIQQATVTAPTDFRVEDLATDIKNALDAISIALPPTAEMWIKKRVIEKMLPNLPTDQMVEILDELEDKRDEALNASAELQEDASATDDGTGDLDPSAAGDNATDEETSAPAAA
jgi:hypothetical protein